MRYSFGKVIRWTGVYERGLTNAWDIRFHHVDLYFEHLPESFDGFTVLQLSDLHLDGMPGLEHKILSLIETTKVDLCALTGDYQKGSLTLSTKALCSLETLILGIESRYGFFGVLGNHDLSQMVAPLEAMGIHLLINENAWIEKDKQRLQLIGTDDVHYFFTEQAIQALSTANQGFTLALIHSPEIFDHAAEQGVDLYLSGHTHGGQVCLPGGIPILKHLRRGKSLYKGHWQYQGMQGITNSGAGTSAIPIRFNCPGEILHLTLHRTV